MNAVNALLEEGVHGAEIMAVVSTLILDWEISR